MLFEGNNNWKCDMVVRLFDNDCGERHLQAIGFDILYVMGMMTYFLNVF